MGTACLLALTAGCHGSPSSSADLSSSPGLGPADAQPVEDSAPPSQADSSTSTADGGGGTDAAAVDAPGDELGPPIDAAVIDVKTGSDAVCQSPLAWWATDAAFDGATPTSFASAINPLLVAGHPFTVADYEDTSLAWTLRVSGTLTNGNLQQYFPFDHPADTTPMLRPQASFASAAPASSAWLYVVDAGGGSVWIPIAQVTVSALYVDIYCQYLTGGQLQATIPASAGPTTVTTSQGTTTLGALLGAVTSQQPPGWAVELSFGGEKVQVSSK
jgi:hypothetical protein